LLLYYQHYLRLSWFFNAMSSTTGATPRMEGGDDDDEKKEEKVESDGEEEEEENMQGGEEDEDEDEEDEYDDDDRDDYYDGPPLVHAAHPGDIEMCRHLIASNANVHARGVNQRTALMFAAGNGHTEICRLLLASNADVETTVGEELRCVTACRTSVALLTAQASRAYKLEAGHWGCQLAAKACYDPHRGAMAFANLAKATGQPQQGKDWFATHPHSADRLLEAVKHAKEYISIYQDHCAVLRQQEGKSIFNGWFGKCTKEKTNKMMDWDRGTWNW
jgi:hypothetical protein